MDNIAPFLQPALSLTLVCQDYKIAYNKGRSVNNIFIVTMVRLTQLPFVFVSLVLTVQCGMSSAFTMVIA